MLRPKQKKSRCENCPARNSRVRTSQVLGKLMTLCPECRAIATRMDSQDKTKAAQTQS